MRALFGVHIIIQRDRRRPMQRSTYLEPVACFAAMLMPDKCCERLVMKVFFVRLSLQQDS